MSLIGMAQNVWQLVALRLLAGLLGGYASGSNVLVATQTPRAHRLGAGRAVVGHHGRQPGGAADRRRAAAADRHPHDVLAAGAVIFVTFLATTFLIKEERDRAGPRQDEAGRGGWSLRARQAARCWRCWSPACC
jgi:hypothetical protein